MKFDTLKPDDPWFATEETRALVVWLREQKAQAVESVVVRVRDQNVHAASEFVGQRDAFGKVLTMIQEGK